MRTPFYLPKILCQINQEILKTSKKQSEQFESSSTNVQMVGDNLLIGCSTSCFIYGFVIPVINEKETFYMKIIVTKIPKKSVRNYGFISFLSFFRNQTQESNFQQVGGLVTRNICLFLFLASHTLFQSHTRLDR